MSLSRLDFLKLTSILSGVLLTSFLMGSLIAVAAPPASKYNPGETLDPTCGPGDTNCTVQLPSGGGGGGTFAWTPESSGNATSTNLILKSGFVSSASSTINGSTTIGTSGDNFIISNYDYGVATLPTITPVNDAGIGANGLGVWKGLLAIAENLDNPSNNPTLVFSKSDITDSATITYSTTTDRIDFATADGGYTFDNDVYVTSLVDATHFVATSSSGVSALAGHFTVGGNSTTTGFAVMSGTTTLGTTADNFIFSNYDYGVGTIPTLTPLNDAGLGVDSLGALRGSLAIVENTDTPSALNPAIFLSKDDISDSAIIFYSTTTDAISFSSAAGGYFFDRDVSVGASVYATGLVDASYFVATSSSATSTFAGNLTVGGNASITGNTTFLAGIRDGSSSFGTNNYVLATNGTNEVTWTDPNSLVTVTGDGDPFAWSVNGYGVATSTTLGFTSGFVSSASSTITATTTITGDFYSYATIYGQDIDIGSSYSYKQNGLSILGTNATNDSLYVGSSSVDILSADSDTAVGFGALQSVESTGSFNTAIGVNSLNLLTTGDYNTAVGYNAGNSITTGLYNTIIGGNGEDGITEGSSNIAICPSGTNSCNGVLDPTGNSQFILHRYLYGIDGYNDSISKLAMGSTTPYARFTIVNSGGKEEPGLWVGGGGEPTLVVTSYDVGYSPAVGIGTSDPQAGFHMMPQSGTSTNRLLLGENANSGSVISEVSIKSTINASATLAISSGGIVSPRTWIIEHNNGTYDGGLLIKHDIESRPILLHTNDATSGAKVGIATTSPFARLSITGEGTGTDVNFQTADSNNNPLVTMRDNGNVGIGHTAPGVRLIVQDTIDGNIFRLIDSDGNCAHNPESGSVTVSCSSDESLKTNIVDINASSTIADLMKYRIREYDVIASGDTLIGVVAQELQEDLPDRVSENEDGLLMVEMPNMWEILVAVQEVFNMFSEIGVQVVDGVARFGDVVMTTLTADKVIVTNGVELFDHDTGEVYCVIVNKGKLEEVRGECDEVNPTRYSNEEPDTPETNESPNDNDSTPTVAGTSTPPIIEDEDEQTSTSTDPITEEEPPVEEEEETTPEPDPEPLEENEEPAFEEPEEEEEVEVESESLEGDVETTLEE